MRTEEVHWPSGQPLTEHYINRFSLVERLFEYNPWNFESYRERALWLDRSETTRVSRSALADVLTAYNRKIGNSEQALEFVRQFRDESAYVVIGGQQAGLLTGPLLVIYKAVTVIQEARDVSARLGKPVIPVFWIAGEDHDFDEVNHIYVGTSEPKITKISISRPAGKRNAVSRLPISPEEWSKLFRQLAECLDDTEYKKTLLGTLEASARRSFGLADSFASLLAMLFGEYGLVLIDSDDPGLRELEKPMFRLLIDRNEAINAALMSGKSAVEASGYTPQTEIADNHANLFMFQDDERVLLFRDGDNFRDKRKERTFSRSDLLHLAEREPQQFSNNVLSRPLMQDYLFPVLSAVLGPSEIAYWGLLREAFRAADLRMPIAVPRLEFTLLDSTVQKHMHKFGLDAEDVLFRLQQSKRQWLSVQDDMQLDRRFAEVKERFTDIYSPLLAQLSAMNPALQNLAATNLRKIMEQLHFMQTKAADYYQSRFDAVLRQFDRVDMSVSPLGKPQERVYNIFVCMNKYGDQWLHELIRTPVPRNGRHRMIFL